MTTPRRLQQPVEPWGSRFYARRVSLGLTQAHIAKTTGLTQQSISRIERNQVIPKITTLELLARAVGTTVDELFPIAARPRVAS